MNSTINKARPRPLSPHLQVYSWLITSTLSILHRLTGVALAAGLAYLAVWLITAAYYPECYNNLVEFSGSILGQIILIGWSAALYYHTFNGIRHLFWDTGRGFELKNVARSGWSVLIATVVFTALTWGVVLGYINYEI